MSLNRRWATATLIVAVASLVGAAGASASNVEIVSQGEPPAVVPHHVHYFKTIQAAVNATKHGDWVLVEPGIYTEEVKVLPPHSGIWIRGMNRNTVILDGQHKPLPNGSNGIEVNKADNVWIQNLTVRNYDRSTVNGENGNEIWWNGGFESKKTGAHGWYGSYLTAYDDGLTGGYGLFADNMIGGSWENVYTSGFADSGLYIGACKECQAKVNKATVENNALGYSGSNSGGNLVIENSVFRHNNAGIDPNSNTPGDGPPPQNGACNPQRHYGRFNHKLPEFTSTEIAHCTIIRDNLVEENNNKSTPADSGTAGPWGVGVELGGVYGDLVEHNTITGNNSDGVLGFEYPNPYPPTEQTIYFALAGNKISDNVFSGNGIGGGAGGTFAGDIMLFGGLFRPHSTMNCVSGNTFTAATWPAEIEGEWGCQNKTTPNPALGIPGVEYIVGLQTEAIERTPVAQPDPPAQETMPNPCEGVPADPLCP